MYFRNVDNKRCKRFFDVIMALLMKRNSKEKDYIGWSGVLLLFLCFETVTSCLYVHAHLLKCWKTRLGDHRFNCKQVFMLL